MTTETLEFYCLASCDTCRKARRALEGAGYRLTVRDIRRDGVPEEVLRDALERLGRERFLATRSPTWRKLPEDERQQDIVSLMLRYPVLMKRPLIRDGQGGVWAGWSKEVQAELLGAAAG